MAIQPLSGNSKIVVYNSDAKLGSATASKDHQGATISEIVAAAAPAEKVYRAEVNTATGVAKVLKNTTGETITYVSIGAGNIGTAPNATLFGGDYDVYVSATDKAGTGDNLSFVTAKHTTTPAFVEFTRVDANGANSNGTIYVEIALY